MFSKIDVMITVVFAAGLTWLCVEQVISPLHPDLADGLMMGAAALLYVLVIGGLISLIRQRRARRPQCQKVLFSDRDYDWKKPY